jgi:hypothetical protein
VPGVGNVLVQRLAAAGIRSIAEFVAADPRQLELVTTKLYPWGDTKKEDARRLLPPPCSLNVELLGAAQNLMNITLIPLCRIHSSVNQQGSFHLPLPSVDVKLVPCT